MNLNDELALSYLEEDNVQQGYFRVLPQLTSSGDIREEARNTWHDCGALRVVPDRNEKHTFKDRMRSMGSWCVIDLTVFPADASKIRTNKNYKPDQGENNQYIIYSDAVASVPGRVFYEVIEGSPASAAEAAKTVITPSFYLFEKDIYYGPVSRDNPVEPMPAESTVATQFEFDAPDGKMHTILCRADENRTSARPERAKHLDSNAENKFKAASEPYCDTPEQHQEEEKKDISVSQDEAAESMPIGKPLHILDEALTFEETVQGLNKPLSEDANLLQRRSSLQPKPRRSADTKVAGTPLYSTPLSTFSPQPRDRLAEVVSGQRAPRSDPYAEPLPEDAKLNPVFNPIEHACGSFKKAWESIHSRPQLVNCVMSLDGMKALLERRQQLNTTGTTALQSALQKHLSVLEADRLNVLVQLDQARTDLEAAREKVIAESSSAIRREIESLREELESLTKRAEELRSEVAVLGRERAALDDEIKTICEQQLPSQAARILRERRLHAVTAETFLQPIPGRKAPVEDLLGSIECACAESNIPFSKNAAISFLALVTVCKRIMIQAEELAPVVTLIRNLVDALGWETGFAVEESDSSQIICSKADPDSTPSIVMTLTGKTGELPDCCRILLTDDFSGSLNTISYKVYRWPVCKLPKLAFIPRVRTHAEPVNLKSISDQDFFVSPEEIDSILKEIYVLIPRLSGEARDEMNRFICICSGLMEEGLPGALDWAIRLWLIPSVIGLDETREALKPLLYEYPLSLKAIS